MRADLRFGHRLSQLGKGVRIHTYMPSEIENFMQVAEVMREKGKKGKGKSHKPQRVLV